MTCKKCHERPAEPQIAVCPPCHEDTVARIRWEMLPLFRLLATYRENRILWGSEA